MRFLVLILLLLSSVFCSAQGFNFNCTRDTSVIGCAASCITLQATVPDLRASTSSYVVNRIDATGSCFLSPVAPNNTGGASANLIIDDRYSSVIGIGFPFNFYGTNYTQLVISANGFVSFDVTRANKFSHFGILRTGGSFPFLAGGSGTPEDLPSVLYDKGLIMGPYHDLDPSKTTSPDRKVQYQVLGTAPHRRWVLSYYKVPLFSNPCNTLIENTHQIVLYESTGVIEIYIQDMEICPTWNQGRAMIGLQDMSKTNAIMAPGRKASDPAWGSIGMKEVWRFTPATGASLFRRAELYNSAGTMVSTVNTATATNGNLDLSFPNVCSPIGTSEFVVKSIYGRIDNPALDVVAYDTIRIHKTETVIDGTATSLPSLCSPATGEITVTATAGLAPITYSVAGRPFQSSGVFTGLPAGNHDVVIRDATGCTKILPVTVGLTNNLSLQIMPDTTICEGSSFTARVSSNATAFSWSPTTGVSDPTIMEPLLQPLQSRLYELTASFGTCTRKDSLMVTVNPSPDVHAGVDRIIIAGDVIRMNATAAPGSYLWTPSTALTSATILNPEAAPLATTQYSLQVTDAQGCTASDDMLITVFPNCVKPMEAFTPNGDGINDVWMVTNGNCTRSIDVRVFNRYGSTVFSATGYNNNWDGKYKGDQLPDGTYYYVITLHLVSGKSTSVKGNVTILR